jgi:hypothetical protein
MLAISSDPHGRLAVNSLERMIFMLRLSALF